MSGVHQLQDSATAKGEVFCHGLSGHEPFELGVTTHSGGMTPKSASSHLSCVVTKGT